jgi:hypothetical protein
MKSEGHDQTMGQNKKRRAVSPLIIGLKVLPVTGNRQDRAQGGGMGQAK